MKFREFDTFTDADKGKEFEILNPRTKKGVGAYLTVAGPDSSIYRAATEECTKKLTAETTMLEFKTERLIRCTLSWRNIEEGENKEMKFSDANLREFFKYNSLVRDQFISILDENANFLRD